MTAGLLPPFNFRIHPLHPSFFPITNSNPPDTQISSKTRPFSNFQTQLLKNEMSFRFRKTRWRNFGPDRSPGWPGAPGFAPRCRLLVILPGRPPRYLYFFSLPAASPPSSSSSCANECARGPKGRKNAHSSVQYIPTGFRSPALGRADGGTFVFSLSPPPSVA